MIIDIALQGTLIALIVVLSGASIANSIVTVADRLGLVYSVARETRQWAREPVELFVDRFPAHVEDRIADATVRALRATAPRQSPIGDRMAERARWAVLIA